MEAPNRRRAIVNVLVAVALETLATSAGAGELAATSRGSITISVSVAPRVTSRIEEQNSELAEDNHSIRLCGNTHLRTYSVTLLPSFQRDELSRPHRGARAAFELAWASRPRDTQDLKIRPGETVTGLTTSPSAGCGAPQTGGAKVIVKRPPAAVEQGPNGAGAVTLLIAPE